MLERWEKEGKVTTSNLPVFRLPCCCDSTRCVAFLRVGELRQYDLAALLRSRCRSDEVRVRFKRLYCNTIIIYGETEYWSATNIIPFKAQSHSNPRWVWVASPPLVPGSKTKRNVCERGRGGWVGLRIYEYMNSLSLLLKSCCNTVISVAPRPKGSLSMNPGKSRWMWIIQVQLTYFRTTHNRFWCRWIMGLSAGYTRRLLGCKSECRNHQQEGSPECVGLVSALS